MNRIAVSVAFALLSLSCQDARPRALVLVDGSGPPHSAWVAARAAQFEAGGRGVRVLVVGSAADAIQLARRGEAEVALVPESTPIEDFATASHGSEAGRVLHDGAALRVLEVNAAQHPKVDGAGAKSLAAFLVSGGR